MITSSLVNVLLSREATGGIDPSWELRSRKSGSISRSNDVRSAKRSPKSARLLCSRSRFRSILWGDFMPSEVAAADNFSGKGRFLPLVFVSRLLSPAINSF